MPDDSQRYGEREVELILRRARELRSLRDSGEEDLSLAELKEVASRVGIDVGDIQLAAAQLEEISQPSTLDRILGGPTTIWLDRTVDGDVPEASLKDLTQELETATRAEGQATLLGSSLTWRAHDPNELRALLVSVRWGEGSTHIRILERLDGLAWTLFGIVVGGLGCGVGFGVGFGVGLGALGSPLFTTVFLSAALSGSFMLARSIYRVMTRRRERTLRELLDLISDYVSGPSPDPHS